MATESNAAALPSGSVLSLSTVVKRHTITIDGRAYEMRNADELPYLVFRGHANVYKRAGELLSLGRRSDAQERELEALLPRLVEALVIAPRAVLGKLNNDQRFAVVGVFSTLLLMQKSSRKAGAKPAAGKAVRARKGAGSRSGKKTRSK